MVQDTPLQMLPFRFECTFNPRYANEDQFEDVYFQHTLIKRDPFQFYSCLAKYNRLITNYRN